MRPLHPGGDLVVGGAGMAAGPCRAGTAPPPMPAALFHSLFWDMSEFEKKSLLYSVFFMA